MQKLEITKDLSPTYLLEEYLQTCLLTQDFLKERVHGLRKLHCHHTSQKVTSNIGKKPECSI